MKKAVAIWQRIDKRVRCLLKSLKKEIGKRKNPEIGSRFRLTGRFWIYLILILLALVFTQALLSSISSVIFIFLLLLPGLSLLYLWLATLTVKLYLDTESSEVTKFSPVSFSLSLKNESPLPFPFVEAVIFVPSDDAVRCDRQLTQLSLIPFGAYEIKKRLSFSYRGSYEIGVSAVFVQDLFRLFRFRMDLNLFREIFVLPNRLSLSTRMGFDRISEITETVNRMAGQDNTEMSDIRNYQAGDSLRQIHWKLSSKTDDLVVRQYAHNSEKQVVIFCDTASRFETQESGGKSSPYAKDCNEFVVDGVIEVALALAEEALRRAGTAVTLVWFDSRSTDNQCLVRLESPADLDVYFRLFATAPITQTPLTVGHLAASSLSGTDSASVYLVSGAINQALAASIAQIPISADVGVELYTYIPLEKVREEARSSYSQQTEAALSEIAKQGVSIQDARSNDLFHRPTFSTQFKEVRNREN